MPLKAQNLLLYMKDNTNDIAVLSELWSNQKIRLFKTQAEKQR